MKATESWWSESIRYLEEDRVQTLPGARLYKVRWWVPNRFSYGERE
jgi:hypothetical protein